MTKYSHQAAAMDAADPLKHYREQFFIPMHNGRQVHYFSGNSLGLQPKTTRGYVDEELSHWASLGVKGHMEAKNPWITYHSILSHDLALLTGAQPEEVVAMNSLTINLHLMLTSFYRPTASRYKILVNPQLFPSDYFAIASQMQLHGLDPKTAILELPSSPDGIVHQEEIERILKIEGHTISLVLIEAVSYYTGQAFNLSAIAAAAHRYGCLLGVNLAHAIGNIELSLHHDNIDFAVWCSYKYLNGGPGCIGGCFVHSKHHTDTKLPRLAGWWGHNIEGRFKDHKFHPIPNAEGWQISNPPILIMACLKASLDLYKNAGMQALREKSILLTGYLEELIGTLNHSAFRSITPKATNERGCQLSIKVQNKPELLLKTLTEHGFICDLRHPDIMRIAPTPLYNTFADVYKLYEFLKGHLT